jgi:haloalkane dehalogenase
MGCDDPAKIKNERHALTIVMNGPRHFVMDRIVIERHAQPPADFQGLMMNFLAVLHVPWRDLADRRPYTEHTVSRSTRFSFDPGARVYELVSPSGDVYVMQSYSEIVDPNLRMADLQNLGGRLKLPAGWTFSTRILSAPLTMIATGEAHIVQDEFENTYQSLPRAEHALPKQ